MTQYHAFDANGVLEVAHGRLTAVEDLVERTLRWCKRNGIEAPTFAWGADTLQGYTVGWTDNDNRDHLSTFKAAERGDAEAMRRNTGGWLREDWTRKLAFDCRSLLAIGVGARLLGVLSHVDGKTLVTVVRGETVPAEVTHRHGECDHCSCRRRRNETFVVQLAGHAAPCVVGRSCVRAYLGLEPARLQRALELAGFAPSVAAMADEERDGSPCFDRRRVRELLPIVATALAAIEMRGAYMKSGLPNSTACEVWLALDGGNRWTPREDEERARKVQELAASDEYQAMARQAVEWARGLRGGAFELTLRSLAEAGFSVPRTNGSAIYLAEAWRKAHGREAERKAAEDGAAFPMPQRTAVLPQVGAKLTAIARVFEVREVDGQYGVQWRIAGRATDGWDWSVYTTAAQTIDMAQYALEHREAFAFEATVKSHSPRADGTGSRVQLARMKPC